MKIRFDRSYDDLIASLLSREDAELVVKSPDHSDIVAEVGHTNLTLRSKLIDDGKTYPYFAVVMSNDEREQTVIRAGLAVRRDVLVDEARATPDRLLRIVADAVGEPMRVGNVYKTFIENSTITVPRTDVEGLIETFKIRHRDEPWVLMGFPRFKLRGAHKSVDLKRFICLDLPRYQQWMQEGDGHTD